MGLLAANGGAMDKNYSWRGNFCIEVNPLPCTLVVFGVKGDLAKRKLLPALCNLDRRELLHDNTRMVACARSPFDIGEYLHGLLATSRGLERFVSRFSCASGDFDSPAFGASLYAALSREDMPRRIIYYFATSADMLIFR